jgi:hypothetical protein
VIATSVSRLPASALNVGEGPALVMVGEVYADVQSVMNGDELSLLLRASCSTA